MKISEGQDYKKKEKKKVEETKQLRVGSIY
jgi:hypothetical protein